MTTLMPHRARGTLRFPYWLHEHRAFRMLVAGLANTAFGFVAFSALLCIRLQDWLALLLALLLGTAFNFVTSGGYVFRMLVPRLYPRFLACYLLVYAVNLTVLRWLEAWVDSKILAQALLSAPVAVLSYVLMARWVFVKPSGAADTGHGR